MTDYQNKSEQDTNKANGKKKLSLLGPIAIYAAVWVFSIAFFWLFTDGSDVLGYSLLFTWMLLPAAAFITSLLIAAKRHFVKCRWLLIPALGAMHTLAEYFTFSIAYMTSFCKFRIIAPDWMLFLFGAAISAVGLGIGMLINHLRKASDIS